MIDHPRFHISPHLKKEKKTLKCLGGSQAYLATYPHIFTTALFVTLVYFIHIIAALPPCDGARRPVCGSALANLLNLRLRINNADRRQNTPCLLT